jgi:hypothetical protein
MMKRAGYLEKGREPAIDLQGKYWETIELHINGMRLAIRMADLRGALAGRIFAQVERLERNWGLRITGIAGLARLSASGRALNIELNEGGSFTVSLDMLKAVVSRKERFAAIASISAFPEMAEIDRSAEASVQQRLPAGFA